MNDILSKIISFRDQVKEAEKAIDVSGDIARNCLANEDFKLFKDSYARAEVITIDAIIGYTKNFVESENVDLQKYALTIIRLTTKLENLRYLIRTVENTAKKNV